MFFLYFSFVCLFLLVHREYNQQYFYYYYIIQCFFVVCLLLALVFNVITIFFCSFLDLPKDGPHISGEQQQQYQIGDYLNLNCTSGKSHPASVLQWYINDQPVSGNLFSSFFLLLTNLIENGINLTKPKVHVKVR